jgi:predicted amidohydrolase YtcJ
MRNLATILVVTLFVSCTSGPPPADPVLSNGEIYTMEAEQPWTGAVVITGNTISAVLDASDAARAYIGPATRVVDLEGDICGSIRNGKLADITVIDRNLLEIDPAEILDMEIEMTIVDGRVVYERGS